MAIKVERIDVETIGRLKRLVRELEAVLLELRLEARAQAGGAQAPTTLPSLSMPCSTNRNSSCITTRSPSMPAISVIDVILREPSRRRDCWTINWIAPDICSRTTRIGEIDPAHQRHRFDSADRVARRVRVQRGERAVVAGVHRLEHVQRLAAAALADDDPVRVASAGRCEPGRGSSPRRCRPRSDFFDSSRTT